MRASRSETSEKRSNKGKKKKVMRKRQKGRLLVDYIRPTSDIRGGGGPKRKKNNKNRRLAAKDMGQQGDPPNAWRFSARTVINESPLTVSLRRKGGPSDCLTLGKPKGGCAKKTCKSRAITSPTKNWVRQQSHHQTGKKNSRHHRCTDLRTPPIPAPGANTGASPRHRDSSGLASARKKSASLRSCTRCPEF